MQWVQWFMGWEIVSSISVRSKGTINNSQVVGQTPNLSGNGQMEPLVTKLDGRDMKLTNHLLVMRLMTTGTVRLAVM